METCNFSWHNREAVNELYIHDSEFTGYTYTYDISRDAHEILLSCKNYFLQKVFSFTFHRVVYHEMQGCSFWYKGDSIQRVYLGNKKLHELQLPNVNDAQDDPNPCWDYEEYLHVILYTNGGDVLSIFCESFDFREEPLQE